MTVTRATMSACSPPHDRRRATILIPLFALGSGHRPYRRASPCAIPTSKNVVAAA